MRKLVLSLAIVVSATSLSMASDTSISNENVVYPKSVKMVRYEGMNLVPDKTSLKQFKDACKLFSL